MSALNQKAARQLNRTVVLGTGRALPERVVTNSDLEKMMDTSDEWIVKRTGIQQRRWVGEGETSVTLALDASRKALTQAGLRADDIDCIVYATGTPGHFCPGDGVFLQDALGCRTIPAIDIRTQCSGFIYSLAVADGWIGTGLYKNILVVGCEVQSPYLNISDEGRDVAVIFADGAGAAVLGPSRQSQDQSNAGILSVDLNSDGRFAKELWCDIPGSNARPPISEALLAEGRQYIQMNGREVFRHATGHMEASTLRALEKADISLEEVKVLIPHQANLRIIEHIRKSLKLREEQVVANIQNYGNTTAASIPIALDEALEQGRIQTGDIVALTAFGSGFLWGSVILRWGT